MRAANIETLEKHELPERDDMNLESKYILISCFSPGFGIHPDKLLVYTNMSLICREVKIDKITRIGLQVISRLNSMDHFLLPVA